MWLLTSTGISTGQLALAPAVQQVVDAVRLPRGQQPDAGPVVGEARAPSACAKRSAERGERVVDLGPRQVEPVELELDAQEERLVGVVGVLLQVDDVAAVGGDERGGGGDDARLVGAGDEQPGGGGGHAGKPVTRRGPGFGASIALPSPSVGSWSRSRRVA